MKQIISLLLCCILLLAPCSLPASANEITTEQPLPTIDITLDNGMAVHQITKEVNSPASFSMTADGFEPIENQPITIKGRGNSTWKLPKKPYQIKFDSKIDLLGMGTAKKWILLANYWDKTHMRNAMMYRMANRMNNIFSVQCEFVEVYINKEYRGLYLLTEKIETGSNRIDEDTDKGAVLMELEQQYRHANDGCDNCVITGKGVHVTLKEPEGEDFADSAEFDTVKTNTKTKLDAMEDTLTQGYDAYSKVIDVDSFIDWYIQNEVAKNYDAAFVTSSYCYLDEAGLLHMGPVWDVDVCFGNQDVTYPNTYDNGLNYYNYRADKGAWYTALLQDPTFVTMLKARWQEIKATGIVDNLLKDIDTLWVKLTDAQIKDQAMWPDAMAVTSVRDQGNGTGGTPYFTFDEEVEYLKDWLTRRIDWLDSQWNDTYVDPNAYKAVAVHTGEQFYPGSYGQVVEGAWQWPGRSTSIERVIKSSQPMFGDVLTAAPYVICATFQSNSQRLYDSMGVRLVGIAADGSQQEIKSTIATRVTYSVAGKDQEGYANLWMSFDLTGYRYASYGVIVDAYTGAGTLRDITVYQSGNNTTTNTDQKAGDVDGNGTVDAADALLVLKHAVGKITLTLPQQSIANVYQDNSIDAADALQILKIAVGKITL